MKMNVIGAGFGRTGTQSLKIALDMLGVGPCYHMMEVFGHVEHIQLWAAATRGEAVDWDVVFEDYRSTVDWPGCTFWRELAAEYPDAKILLSYRDADDWYDSFSRTIFPALNREAPAEPAWVRQHAESTRALIFERTFGGRPDDRAHVIQCYEAHNEAVRSEVEADRLILYEVGAGWEPLCRALQVEVPAAPYPRTNSTQAFQARMRLMEGASPDSSDEEQQDDR